MRAAYLPLLMSLLALGACHTDERSPAKTGSGNDPAAAARPAPLPVDIDRADLRFTYLDAKGHFRMAQRASEIPEESRGAVMVVDLSRRSGMGDRVPVLDLRGRKPTGRHLARSLDRASFERLAQRLRQKNRPAVVMYATSWCGVCAKARSFLRSEGVEWTERDVEKDPGAARELAAKAARAGIRTQGVPVFDVGGTLIAGFDEGRLRKLLKL